MTLRLTPAALFPGHTPLHVAVIHRDSEMVRLLRDAGADLNKLVSCCARQVCRGGSDAQDPRLFTHRPQTSYSPGMAPVHTLSLPGTQNPPAVPGKEFRSQTPDMTLRLTPAALFPGHTPLHVAVIHRDSEMVRLLRDAGADLNKLEPTCGRSPLHLAVEAQATEVLEILLRAGADPAARMYGGRTPLGSALLRPNPILARLLRAHGAPEPEDEDDKSSPCSSSSDSDSDSRDEGDEYDDIVVHSGRGQNRPPPTPASKPLPDDPNPV
uniref:NF-kappa-B inhibitor alpha n=1 Tax=Spermophilus dauricus TaxID=99837 RepID=A0A8C9P424_SPEDA